MLREEEKILNNSGEDVKQTEEKVDEKDLEVSKLEQTIIELKNEIEFIKKGAADVINRNKQLETDKKYASQDLINNLLVPLSYFEGALKFKSDNESLNNFLKGFEMVYNLLLNQLFNDGLKEITTNVNDEFDPKIHEVMELVESAENVNKIVEIVQKGYYYKDRVIKPVKVKVTKKVNNNIDANNKDTEENIN